MKQKLLGSATKNQVDKLLSVFGCSLLSEWGKAGVKARQKEIKGHWVSLLRRLRRKSSAEDESESCQ